MSTLFDGYFGMGNAGDDAFCRVAYRLGQTAELKPRFLARVGRLPHPIPQWTAVLPADPSFKGQMRLAAMAAVLRASAVIHAGGSTLRRSSLQKRDQTRVAAVGRTRLLAMGVSVGPFRTASDAAAIAQFLRRFEHISVRDEASRCRAEELGIHVEAGTDLAMLLPRSATAQRTDDAPLGVVPISRASWDDGAEDHERAISSLRASLIRFTKTSGRKIRIVTFNSHPVWGDEEVAAWLSAEINASSPGSASTVFYAGDLGALDQAIAECCAVVAMRLHAAVFAYRNGVPFAVVPQHEKLTDFVQHVGLPEEACIRLVDPGATRDVLTQLSDGQLSPLLQPTEATGIAERMAAACLSRLPTS